MKELNYHLKSADYMTVDDERNLVVIKNLEYALAGTRQISYGGLFKQIKQDLKLEDVEKNVTFKTPKKEVHTEPLF
ncbi:protein rep [Levilactobacillus brevis]